MSDSIFDENILGLRTGNDGEVEACEEKAVAGEVVDAVSNDNVANVSHLLEALDRMKDILDDDDDDDDTEEGDEDNGMDADDCHNKAVEYARLGKYKRATEICLDGLKRFPLNVDLLADTIKYSADAGNQEVAAEHFEILKTVPVQRWNWRAFTFSFDYLLGDDPIANEEECRIIIENYKRYIPYEEKAYLAESELEMALGNSERSMKVLEAAVASRENASQCALRLADMQLDRGLYEKVIATANYGIAASAETQPSIKVPYLYFIRALAKDHILHKKECNNETVEKREVDALSAEYEFMLDEFSELMRHAHTIKTRIKMLEIMSIA